MKKPQIYWQVLFFGIATWSLLAAFGRVPTIFDVFKTTPYKLRHLENTTA
jgi:hypothetical protein